MSAKRTEDKKSAERLKKLLGGAFSGPPTPLKDIPKTRERKAKQKEKKTWDSSKEN